HLQYELNAENGDKSTADPEKLEIMKKNLEDDLQTQQNNLNDVTAQTTTLGNASAQLAGLEEEIKAEEHQRAELQSDLDKVTLALKLPPRVVVLNDASVPDAPSSVFRVVLAAFGGLFGIALGSAAVVAMEYH